MLSFVMRCVLVVIMIVIVVNATLSVNASADDVGVVNRGVAVHRDLVVVGDWCWYWY